jgi:hypothetical protein
MVREEQHEGSGNVKGAVRREKQHERSGSEGRVTMQEEQRTVAGRKEHHKCYNTTGVTQKLQHEKSNVKGIACKRCSARGIARVTT